LHDANLIVFVSWSSGAPRKFKGNGKFAKFTRQQAGPSKRGTFNKLVPDAVIGTKRHLPRRNKNGRYWNEADVCGCEMMFGSVSRYAVGRATAEGFTANF
jgi:hypothetical protein